MTLERTNCHDVWDGNYTLRRWSGRYSGGEQVYVYIFQSNNITTIIIINTNLKFGTYYYEKNVVDDIPAEKNHPSVGYSNTHNLLSKMLRFEALRS